MANNLTLDKAFLKVCDNIPYPQKNCQGLANVARTIIPDDKEPTRMYAFIEKTEAHEFSLNAFKCGLAPDELMRRLMWAFNLYADAT